MAHSGALERSRFRDVLAVAEFRTLLVAQTQSRLGDQLARVALSVLVFTQTSSAALTAVVYALTYLPPILSAPLLAGLADRYPRRTVLVVVELIRAALVGVMATPRLPLLLVMMLSAVLACLQPLFSAARSATVPRVLTGDRYTVGMSLAASADSAAQIVGFVIGGAMVALLGGPHAALGIDAVSYLVSAGLVRRGIRLHRPDAMPGQRKRAPFALAGIVLLARDRRLAGLTGLIWLYGLYLAPAALAAPYSHQIGAPPAVIGVLMAADLPGVIAGGLLAARLRPAARQFLVVPLAVATGLPLVATAAAPPVAVAAVLWACSGLLASYVMLAQVAVTRAVPDSLRARTIGMASAGLQGSQGLGVLTAGGIAALTSPAASIALCAAIGCAGAIALSITCRLDATQPSG